MAFCFFRSGTLFIYGIKYRLSNILKINTNVMKLFLLDAHAERLDKVLAKYGIVKEMANGVDIQIDVLAIARKGAEV